MMLTNTFSVRAKQWLIACFGFDIGLSKEERTLRFTEEALELGQAAGLTKERLLELVEYVYSRPVGELRQEVGGVATTLTAFCIAHELDLTTEAERELLRCWQNLKEIREKQKNKPIRANLPIQTESLS